MLTFFGDLENYRIYIYLHLLLTWILCFFWDLIVRICVVCMLTCKKYVNLIKISVDNYSDFFSIITRGRDVSIINLFYIYYVYRTQKNYERIGVIALNFFLKKMKTLFNSVILSSNLQNFLQISTIFENVK